ncbi:MAG: hypothetical protein RBG13Loki_1697 [Promethearchaeota archaeon CR_4]|nr:MAG: hypothetical protein RBG13Loki_1697 [Candidatus Lokiarchaeota archaeon CR_4]
MSLLCYFLILFHTTTPTITTATPATTMIKTIRLGLSLTIIVIWVTAMSPSASVTVSVTVNVPAVTNWWVGFCSIEFSVPSPKFHWNESGRHPLVVVSVNCMACPALTAVALAVKFVTA